MRHERTRPAGLGRRSFLGSSALAVGAVALPRRPRAAPTTIRIAEQFGIGYLPLHVIRDRGLLAKHGREAGIEVEIEWVKLSGGAAMNDGLLSGSIDIASGGVTPLLTLWDRTRGNLDVRRIASSVDAPEPRMIASSECSRCLILVLPLPHDYPSSSLPLLPQRPAYGRLRFATP